MRLDSPTASFAAAVAALKAEDWPGVVECCDTVSVRAFANELRSRVSDNPYARMSINEYLRLTPELSRDAAEDQLEVLRSQFEPANRLREELPSVATVDELLSMEPTQVVAAWLHGRSPMVQIERLAEERRVSRDVVYQALSDRHEIWNFVVLGVVPDGDNVAHVIYRWASAEERGVNVPPSSHRDIRPLESDVLQRAPVQSVACRRDTDGRWGLIADVGFFSLGSSMYYFAEHWE